MPDGALKFTVVAPRGAARLTEAALAVAASVLLALPALWNGFPLLEYDTGGYLARWYEGYLVPSRPAPYGLLLNLGSLLDFWPVVALQCALTVWVVTLTMRSHGLQPRPLTRLAIFIMLALATTLPWIASVLLTDIFIGLAVLGLYLMIFRAGDLDRIERTALIVIIALAAATHSASLLLVIALGTLAAAGAWLWPALVPRAALKPVTSAIVLGFVILLAGNFVVTKRLAWTPGGYGIVFGRLLEDGVVNRYLDDHCGQRQFKLCAVRNTLPRNADVFLWGDETFNRLGRFDGLGAEMRTIVLESLADYPLENIWLAIRAAARQMVSVRTGEGVLDSIWHTYGMIEDHTPWNVPAMRAARQQHSLLHFDGINRLHVPVALFSMLMLLAPLLLALRRRRTDSITPLAASVTLAILVNAAILGPLSNPHDRYGARIVWLAPLVVALWLTQRRETETRHEK
ncbi:MAG: hypothetical protein BGP08_15175 [Rhizobiales bacterium 64-17]|nr:MAG: hypothetical protein BGP08_15175 [Rhizobiales bacterium 64-17]